jgi:hypothetical protein
MPAELHRYDNLAELLALAFDGWYATGLVAIIGELNICRMLYTYDQHSDHYWQAQP